MAEQRTVRVSAAETRARIERAARQYAAATMGKGDLSDTTKNTYAALNDIAQAEGLEHDLVRRAFQTLRSAGVDEVKARAWLKV